MSNVLRPYEEFMSLKETIGLNITDLSKKLGLSRTHIYDMVNKQKTIQERTLIQMRNLVK